MIIMSHALYFKYVHL